MVTLPLRAASSAAAIGRSDLRRDAAPEESRGAGLSNLTVFPDETSPREQCEIFCPDAALTDILCLVADRTRHVLVAGTIGARCVARRGERRV